MIWSLRCPASFPGLRQMLLPYVRRRLICGIKTGLLCPSGAVPRPHTAFQFELCRIMICRHGPSQRLQRPDHRLISHLPLQMNSIWPVFLILCSLLPTGLELRERGQKERTLPAGHRPVHHQADGGVEGPLPPTWSAAGSPGRTTRRSRRWMRIPARERMR